MRSIDSARKRNVQEKQKKNRYFVLVVFFDRSRVFLSEVKRTPRFFCSSLIDCQLDGVFTCTDHA